MVLGAVVIALPMLPCPWSCTGEKTVAVLGLLGMFQLNWDNVQGSLWRFFLSTHGRSCVLTRCSVLQVILKEKVKELNLHEICAVCLEEFKPKDELGICPCKHAFHRKCLIKWLEVRKVCPLCNMPVLQLAQLHKQQDPGPPQGPLPGAENIV